MSELDEIRELLKNSKIFAAHKLLQTLPDDLIIPDDIPVDSVNKRIALVNELRELANSNDKWNLQRDSDGIKTMYRYLDEDGVYSIRIEGPVKAPMFDLLAIFHEVDLYRTWLPSYQLLGLRESYTIEDPSPVEVLARLAIAIPPPFSDRDVVVYCDGIDCLDEPDNKQVVVLMTSIEHDSEPVDEYIVRAEVLAPSGVLLTPLGDGTTYVSIVININPKIAMIPSWLIDLAVRNFAYLVLIAVREATVIVQNDEYQERMRDGMHPFFSFIRKRLAESMPEELAFVPDIDDSSFESASSLSD